MENQPKDRCFRKTLTRSDVRDGLEIPRDAENLPVGDEIMLARDGSGREWKFEARIREDGRRFMGNGWRRFVKDASVQMGHQLTYYRMADDFYLFGRKTSPNVYYVRIQR